MFEKLWFIKNKKLIWEISTIKPKMKKNNDYKSELLNLYPSLYYAFIFLYSVHFKLFFNSKKKCFYFYRLLVEYKVLITVNDKIPK
jgi:hypothetical protein